MQLLPRVQKKIKETDENLSDPDKFKELSQDPTFFEKYEKNQQKLKEMEQNWEELNLELNTLKS